MREALAQLFSSLPYKAWAKTSPTDAKKVALEYQGLRRPQPSSTFARALVALCRLAPPNPTLPPPPPPVGNLFSDSSGVFLRDAHGGTETAARSATAYGYKWIAINTGDVPTLSRWARIISENPCIVPWARVRSASDVYALILAARQLRSVGLIVNLEDEAKDVLPPRRVRDILLETGYEGAVAISTLGWVYNSGPGGVDWRPLGEYPVLLQMFTGEVPALKGQLSECIKHAFDEGFKVAKPTWQAYATQGVRPYPEDWDGHFSVYTGDDVDNWTRFPVPKLF